MLDDLVMIHTKDAQDALGIAEKQWQQLGVDFSIPEMTRRPENVVFAGMGGSALGALLAATYPGYKVPFEVSRNYSIPEYVDKKTLFIASSYSGNTEETLEALSIAEKTGATIMVIAGGGKLVEIAKDKNYPLALLPEVTQPRYAVLYSFRALLSILVSADLLDEKVMKKEVENAALFLKKHTQNWSVSVETAKNPAKKLALDLVGKSIVIYGGPLTYPAAYKWKISFNENAKNIAWVNQYPEFNHNEFLGWTSHPLDKPYAVIDLRSSFEHPQVQKRFDVSARLLSGKRPTPHTINAEGETLLEQLLWLVAMGDFVSLYLALLNGLNPTPVDLIEKFKKELN
jgi:glucose/mannose-6-phosphate isomerase